MPDPTRAAVVWAQLGGNIAEPMYLVKSSNKGTTWSRVTSGLPVTMYRLQVGVWGRGRVEIDALGFNGRVGYDRN